ncbi:MAG TPA: glycoside hydrolase family 2 TIM barrel-domain containing protein [Bacteroidales bacterium]
MNKELKYWHKVFVLALVLAGLFINTFGKDSIVNSSRSKININREWKFQLGDFPGAEKTDYSDNGWQNVGLPHSFSIPYFLSPEFYTGFGWYRKHLNIEDYLGTKRYSLEFEGVFRVTEVYVNGTLTGTHRGGYNGFSIDITKALHKGDNIIAVRVSNIWDAQLAPRAGEHVFSGGIYRDVWLVETAPVHVAWYGTFVTTPGLSEASGKVNMKTEVVNEGDKPSEGEVKTVIVDPDRKEVAAMETRFKVESGKTVEVDQTSSNIPNPKLWSPATPFLYKAMTKIIIKDKVVDTYETTFGMRWVEWTADKGFFLNGKHFYFKGVNVHQDHAGWGDAVTNAGFYRDVKLMKDAGFDFIRGSHYPHDPAFSDACDSVGMLFWSENCFWGIGGFKPEGDWSCSAYPTKKKDEKPFEESVKQSLTEMIRIHRNHPSIVVWSMSNEPFFTEAEQMPKVRKFLKELVLLSHELDPTRVAAIGGCQRGEIDKLGDVAGYNGDGAKLYLNPGIPNVVTEYGSIVADRPGEYIQGYGELQHEQFTWRSGQVIWCGFDHGSIAGHFGCMGVVDYFRIPKKQWFWYRNEYNHIPPPKWPEEGIPAALHLTASKTTIETNNGTDDVQLVITIVDKNGAPISNSLDVKLEIVSGPGEFPTGSSILFQNGSDIVIRDGKAAIEFRSYYAGKTVIRASSPGLEPAEVTIVTKGSPAYKATTPQIIERPYVRYRTEAKNENDGTVNLLADRPTKVSSISGEHSSRMANDQEPSTYWQADEKDTENAWWQVDMENIYNLSQIKLTFKEETNAKYTVAISMDGTNWTKIVDRTNTTTTGKSYTETPTQGNRGRFLRVSFVGCGQVPNIADIEAFGKHVD